MNRERLKEKIAQKGLSVSTIASAISIDKSTFYRKLDGQSKFTIDEAREISKILELTQAEVDAIFFNNEIA